MTRADWMTAEEPIVDSETANSATADQLFVDSATADRMNVDSVTADRMNANSATADQLFVAQKIDNEPTLGSKTVDPMSDDRETVETPHFASFSDAPKPSAR